MKGGEFRYISDSGRETWLSSVEELAEAIHRGEIKPDTMLCTMSLGVWQAAGQTEHYQAASAIAQQWPRHDPALTEADPVRTVAWIGGSVGILTSLIFPPWGENRSSQASVVIAFGTAWIVTWVALAWVDKRPGDSKRLWGARLASGAATLTSIALLLVGLEMITEFGLMAGEPLSSGAMRGRKRLLLFLVQARPIVLTILGAIGSLVGILKLWRLSQGSHARH